MKISIFGLGYVGAVSAGCLSQSGHAITGIDVHPAKVELLSRGEAPISEPKLSGLLCSAHSKGLLEAISDSAAAVRKTDLSIVCVGTPTRPDGGVNTDYVSAVFHEIAQTLKAHPKFHVVVLRSTVPPGTTARLFEEHFRDLPAPAAVTLYFHPEFMREGTAVDDYLNPVLNVIGSANRTPPDDHLARTFFGPDLEVVDWTDAELLKYACNAFHATKVAFANEVGRFGKAIGANSMDVMRLLCRDTRLNLSPYYMRPGNPFGGSCLPKDVRGFACAAATHQLELPVISHLLASNDRHFEHMLQCVLGRPERDITILGLTFKADTDDLRESSMVRLAAELLAQGRTVRIFEPNLHIQSLVGLNKASHEKALPQLPELLEPDLAKAVGTGGVVVAAQRCAPLTDLRKCIRPGHHVIDINGWLDLKQLPSTYEGLCW